jgi:DNA-binding winged helix-turn-helix (wHTH) protein
VLSIDRIRFGDFEFDRLNRLLYRDGAELALPPRAVGVLSCLIDRPGQIVPKQVLLDEVWKDANVTETSLTEAVSLLRQALVDDPQRPTFIQTVPRRGYRFVATARAVNGEAAAAANVAGAEGAATGWTSRAGVNAGEGVSDAAARSVTGGQTIADSRELVEEAEWPAWLPWLFVVVMLGVMGGIILAVIRQPSSYARPVVRFGVELPAGVELAREGVSLALSRDGRRVAFVARRAGGSGAPRIYVRNADRLDPIVLEGTDGASSPFFSPDAGWIGFFAGGALKKVPSVGGSIVTLCEARAPLGAVWSTRRFIVFASSLTGGLSRIHEDGGTPGMLTAPDAAAGEVRHAWPDLLPDDAGVVFAGLPLAGGPEAARVGVLSFETGRVQTLVEAATSPHVAPTGHLLFARDRAVYAAPFDPETLEILGQAVPVLDDVATADAVDAVDAVDANAVSQFAVASGGHAAAIRLSHPEASATYRWVRAGDIASGQRTIGGAGAETTAAHRVSSPAAARGAAAVHATAAGGKATDTGAPGISVSAVLPFPAREIRWLALSPDGTRLAMARGDGHRSEIWMSDANGGGLQRLTSDGQNITPVWTADSQRVIYASRQDGPFSLFAKTVGEAAAAAVAVRIAAPPGPSASTPSASARQRASVAADHQTFPASASNEGLVYVDVNPNSAQPRTGLDLWFLPWSGDAPQPLVRTPADETSGVISPDGRWLAYQSNAPGTWTAMISARPQPRPDAAGATEAQSARAKAAEASAAAALLPPARDTPGGSANFAAVRIATTDGARLAWSPDGRYLLFTRDGQLWQAAVTPGGPTTPAPRPSEGSTASPGADSGSAGEPRLLAADVDASGGLGVAPDGRVLVRTREASAGLTRLELVLDWSRELSAKVPIKPRPARTVR